MLGATIFTPIAWNHYYIFMVVPLILVLDDYLRDRSYVLLSALIVMIVLLNHFVLFRQAEHLHIHIYDPLRGQLYAGALAMLCMLFLWWRRKQESELS